MRLEIVRVGGVVALLMGSASCTSILGKFSFDQSSTEGSGGSSPGSGCTSDSECGPAMFCYGAAGTTTKTCHDSLCSDGLRDGTETGIDCGGGTCPACATGTRCKADSDCVTGDGCSTAPATAGTCVSHCADGHMDDGETGADCGGSCSSCGSGMACTGDTDCSAGEGCSTAGATQGTCVNQCMDGHLDGAETAADCGGSTCSGCAVGQRCAKDSDCASPEGCDAVTQLCAANQCTDGIKDGEETDQDCGGMVCPACGPGKACLVDGDCQSGDGCSTKADGTVNTCVPHCMDGHTDDGESDADCGGACSACTVGGKCATDADCTAGNGCSTATGTAGTCVAHCLDGHADQGETGSDCGGTCTPIACGTGQGCTQSSDCVNGDGCSVLTATANTCQPHCMDGITDEGESALDCGGSTGCSPCGWGLACSTNTDCMTGHCCAADCGSSPSNGACGAINELSEVAGIGGDDSQYLYAWYRTGGAVYEQDASGLTSNGPFGTGSDVFSAIAANATYIPSIAGIASTTKTDFFSENPATSAALGTLNSGALTATINNATGSHPSLTFWSDNSGDIYFTDILLKPFAAYVGYNIPGGYSATSLATEGTTVFYVANQELVGLPYTYVSGDGVEFGNPITFDVNANAVAVDNTYVYWTDTAGYIMRAGISGADSTQLVSLSSSPVGIAVNPTGIYWTTSDGNVMKSAKDGTNVVTLAQQQTGPTTVHPTTTKVWWFNSGAGSLGVVDQ